MSWMETEKRVVVGISGASGAPYGVRLIELLAIRGIEVHVAVSDLGRRLLGEEAGIAPVTSRSILAVTWGPLSRAVRFGTTAW